MPNLPDVHPDPALPAAVTIYEVGARDGLQNEATPVPTKVKLELLARLAAAGLTTIEATSMVRPDRVPQLADAEELLAELERVDGVRYPVLVPNAKGLGRALEAGVRDVAVFASATDAFAQRNLGRGRDEQMEMFEPVVTGAVEAGARVRGYVSMVFGDPWEGPVPLADVVEVGRALLDLGCDELSLGDTIGVGTPGHVTALVEAFGAAGVGPDRLGLHAHDTYGQALANTLAALRAGVTVIDASAGGLGGCPFAESATGNLATEDLVWMLDGLGIAHGVDLPALAETSRWMAGQLGRDTTSRVVRALGG